MIALFYPHLSSQGAKLEVSQLGQREVSDAHAPWALGSVGDSPSSLGN